MRAAWIALILLAATGARAEDLVCSIAKIERKVEVQKSDGAWQPATVGMALVVGDKIHTGFKAVATVKFPDTSEVEVKPMSLVLIQKLDDGTGQPKSRVWLRLGEVSATVNRTKGNAADFHVRTPTTTASVRGTRIERIAYHPGIGTVIEMGSHGLLEVTSRAGRAHTGAFDASEVYDENARPERPEDMVREDISAHLLPRGTTRGEQLDVRDLGVPMIDPPNETGAGFLSNIANTELQVEAPAPPATVSSTRVIVNFPVLP